MDYHVRASLQHDDVIQLQVGCQSGIITQDTADKIIHALQNPETPTPGQFLIFAGKPTNTEPFGPYISITSQPYPDANSYLLRCTQPNGAVAQFVGHISGPHRIVLT